MVTFYPLLSIKNLIKSYPTNPYRINSKILNKIFSNLLESADVYGIKICASVEILSFDFQRHFSGTNKKMSNQPRVAKVLLALLLSMTLGAIVLMTLGNNPPSAGAFSLWSYSRLDPIEIAITSQAAQAPNRWNCIEIYYSNTKAGNIEQLASLNGLAGPAELNCHFCICNGLGGGDGQVQVTEKWQRQWSIIPGGIWYGTGQTIRICVVADSRSVHPTDSQIKRTEALVEGLCRKFNIAPDNIYYPNDWQQ